MKQPEQKEEKTADALCKRYDSAEQQYFLDPCSQNKSTALIEAGRELKQKCSTLQADLKQEQNRINEMEKDWREINHKYIELQEQNEKLREALKKIRIITLFGQIHKIADQALSGSPTEENNEKK